ncbi:MAG: secretin N-terminal domain-containing protein [Candidatus Omnitrophica bacterium]|nr:secretin N-terminal domain-containing protein [Candidatus Omnitrophota bacterium]
MKITLRKKNKLGEFLVAISAKGAKQPFLVFLFLGIFILQLSFGAFPQEVIPVIKFKDADIKVVLQSIAQKATKDGKKINIVVSPKVEGLVTVNLEAVDWQTALRGVLDAYGYSYKWVGDNIVLVATIEEIKERDLREKERQEIEVPKLKVFKLKYLDANDAKKSIAPLLSPVGKASVLETTGQAGWEFGQDVTKRKRIEEGQISRTKVLVVSDVSKNLDEVEKLLKEIDRMPKQILIKAKVMEVDRNLLRDIGFEFGTGTTGASSSTFVFDQLNLNGKNSKNIGGHSLSGQTPSVFPSSTALNANNTGLKIDFKHLTGAQFEVVMHALEDDTDTNILSAPAILTLNNQEASIMVGTKFPILKTEVSEQSSQIIGGSLDRYQDIGIQLNVVPQACGEEDEYINMIIHPVVSTQNGTSKIQSGTTILAEYPIIDTREAQTQVVVKDGETIVIGGMLKDSKAKERTGVPILKDIPLLGWAFSRDSYYSQKIDLLIFITVHVVKPGEIIPPDSINNSRAVVSKAKQ